MLECCALRGGVTIFRGSLWQCVWVRGHPEQRRMHSMGHMGARHVLCLRTPDCFIHFLCLVAAPWATSTV